MFSSSSPLDAQSVPTLGSTKQFANDELKPYVDAAKAGATDSGTFLNSVNNGEQVLEAAWETGVNAEIEAIVGGVNNSDTVNNVNVYKDAVRAQLELQKQQAKSQWIADVNAYIQAELQIFLATLSQNTSNNVTSTNTNSVQTINPTVQNVTTTPVSQNTNPAQAAQSYYQGSQLWNSKWQDLLTKQNTWEQNSLNAIQNGILQWNQSITGLENDKLSYLNGIEQTKAQWLANKQLITNAQSQMRNALQSTITNIRSQENQLKANAASDPSLTSVFGDMDELLEDLQDALNSNASLGTLAQTLGNFFQSQISNATAKADYWNITKWQETYATQTVAYSQIVGNSSISCTNYEGSGCNNVASGNRSIVYNSNGSVYGWRASSGSLVYQSDETGTVGQGSYGSSAYIENSHYQISCQAWDLGGTCVGGFGGYESNGVYCGDRFEFCGYTRDTIIDQNYTVFASGTFNQQQITNNNNIRNAIFGSYNTAFGQSSQAGNAVAGSGVALETKVYLGGTALSSSNWYGSLGLNNQVQIQTKYKYIDTAMQANQNFWTSMKTQFTNIASTFLSLVNPLKDWEERSQTYEQEYQAKLLELEQTKQSTVANYNNQISLMKAARGAWVTEVYGYQMAGIEGSADNANSQFRTGQENWNDTISIFQQAELNWYLSAKDTLQQAVTSPNGETQYQTNAIPQANQLQTQITNSETNTSNLYNAATGLYQTYQYAAAGNVMQQALTNQQNQTSWNQQGTNLSQSIADSFGRSEAYKTAELSASNRINALAQTIYGNGAYIVDNAELQTLQTQITTNGQNQTFWQNEINGTNGGFNFNGRATTSQSKETLYTDMIADISVATTLQAEVVDDEITYLKAANEYFDKSERYQELADKAKSEAKFDEAALYTGYAVREKSNALGYLKKKYYSLGEEITSEIDNRGLTYTKNSFLSYRDNLLNKNFQNTTQINKQIQEGKNAVAGIISEGESYNQIQGMIQTASNLNKQGEENKTRVEKLLLESKELANRNIGEGLLDGLQEMIASIQSALPQEVSNNGVAQYIQAQEKELEEKQKKADELLSHMNLLVTNNNDLAALQTLLQGSSQAINLAANSAVSKYLDDYAKKLQKDNEERSANLQKTFLEALTNGDEYKYLRDAGYSFRTDGEGISAYREIYSGEIEIDGSAMKSTSYSTDLEYQYIRMETKFNPGNLSVDMMNPNATRFNAEMAIGIKTYIDNLQKNVETMFAQFSNKTNEIKEEYTQNEEIEDYKKELYKENRDTTLATFQALPGDLKNTFDQEMGGLKGYHEQGSKYNFSQGSLKDQSGDMKKVGKAMYEGTNIDDTVFAGNRELKGSVSVKGIPVEVSYGMQYLIVTSGFDISNLGYNFNLKLVGTQNAETQISMVNQKYAQYSEDIESRIEKQAKANDAEKESKGFLFTILNGMNGGSGSMGQRFTQAVKSEAQSRITGAVAEATGLPASLVGALVGGSSMKDAVKAYVKDETVNAISKATGIPTWLISNQMEKMNKPKEQWYQSQEFQIVTTVVAVAAAPFTGGASLMVAMAVGAGLGAATGAASGGLKGALVGAVGGAAGAAVKSFTGGAVNVGLSYSAENGFGASVGVGYGPATVSVGISERGGTSVDVGLTKGGFNAGLNYNSKTGSVSGSTGFTSQSGTGFALSYNEGDGFGASLSKSFSNGVNGGISWSEKGGVGGNIGYEAPGDKNKPKDSLANQMKGAGGTLSFSQRDGVSAALNASGGVNAGNWSESGGFQANTNFLADKWKADFVSGKAKEDADAQEASRAAQNKNNSESGAAAIAGAGVATQRREEDGILDHILGKAAETLGGGLDWLGNKIDGAIDSVVGVASSAWDGAKNAFGGNEVESLCFVEGTLVLTGRGLKTIEKIKVGEEVLAYDPKTETQTFKSVVRLFRNETEELVKIKFGNDMEVVTTPGHRFFTDNRGFVLAGELTKEDLLFDKSEQSVRIHTIEKETLKEKTRVFNFEVADYHTYYVSEECILVHNDSVKMLQERLGGEKPGFFSGLGEKFSNLMSGNGFNTNASLNSGPVKIVAGSGGGKATGDILEDSNGKLYQKQTKGGKTEWVEVNPATMNPERHAEGQALMAQGAANGDLAAYSKGLAMTKGYGWNENGLNMVGIRVPVDSQNAVHDDYMLAINKGKLEGVYFASTQPGQKSYNGSAALGGVGEISTGHFNMVGVDKTAGAWKHAYLAGMADGTVPGARDVNADGNHSAAERSMENLKKMTEVFIHQGGNDSVKFSRDDKTKTITADYVPGKVGNISQGCQVPNQSYSYNAQTGQNEVFTTSSLNKMAGQHGAFNSMETLLKNNPKFGYSVINSSDYTSGMMNQLNDLRTNAKEEYMQAELQNYLKKKPQYQDYNVQFNR
ncbi:TIGR04388 family protein [Leptospira borgpetersenii]|uniref:Intein N-terminal splicing domain protein n=2 Tax=Leptospira borgpetersenii TaxID=174 RepID=A0ABC9SDY6_LEPBO|nr:TIGR04388 family protein [Leptospira borgpetersenii]EMN12485.1 intein N-terminal splicing domain protein [Leptospira borgpetersenii str. Brem 307]EMN15988.1 intein N-terminal splicing domain protein [Leptospira borgpetersenii str. Brem 328]